MKMLLGVVSLALLFSLGGRGLYASDPQRIVYGLGAEPATLDPHRGNSVEMGIILRQVYDTLIYRDPTSGVFVPGLAMNWTLSQDGLVYTFQLRQDVSFHDGTPFDAQAVAFNLDRILDPETGSQKAIFMLGPYAGYQVIDRFTIALLLAQPYAGLLDALSQVYLGMGSPAAFAAVSTERYQFNQVGSGPFAFVEYIPGERVVLRRASSYTWGPDFINPVGESSIEEIEFRFFERADSRGIALESGSVDVMSDLLPIDARAFAAETGVAVQAVSIPGQPIQFMMNTSRFPTDTLPLRQALILSANRDAIVDTVFQRFSRAAFGPLATSSVYYSRTLDGAYAFDINQARSLLADAGFVDSDANGFLDSRDGDLRLRVVVPSWDALTSIGELLQEQWRAVGIRVELVDVPTRAALFESVSTGDYNLVPWYESGVEPDFLSTYFSSVGSLNWTGYTNSSLDDVLAQAAAAGDPQSRAALYAQAQQVIMSEALILPIQDYVRLVGVDDGVKPIEFDYFGWYPVLANAGLNGS